MLFVFKIFFFFLFLKSPILDGPPGPTDGLFCILSLATLDVFCIAELMVVLRSDVGHWRSY